MFQLIESQEEDESSRPRFLLSIIGTVLLVLWAAIFWVIFVFVTAEESYSQWQKAFQLFTFMAPVFCIILSFVVRRTAATLMLICILISASIGFAYVMHRASEPSASHSFNFLTLIAVLQTLIADAVYLYFPPALFASLLLIPNRLSRRP